MNASTAAPNTNAAPAVLPLRATATSLAILRAAHAARNAEWVAAGRPFSRVPCDCADGACVLCDDDGMVPVQGITDERVGHVLGVVKAAKRVGAVKPAVTRLTKSQRAKVRELIEDEGASRAEAVAWVLFEAAS